MPQQTFDGIPDPEPALAPGRSVIVAAVVVTSIAGLFAAQFPATPSAVAWSVTGGALKFHERVRSGDFRLRDMQLEQIRILDLNRDSGWKPWVKSHGFNGFGLKACHYELRNGTAAEVCIAAETAAVLIPRRGGAPPLAGTRGPHGILAALKGTVTPPL